jgi:hypothetical protein
LLAREQDLIGVRRDDVGFDKLLETSRAGRGRRWLVTECRDSRPSGLTRTAQSNLRLKRVEIKLPFANRGRRDS